MTVRHMVLIRLREGTTADQIAGVTAGLAALPPEIPQIRRYTFGPNVGPHPTNAGYGLVADFASLEDFRAYVEHPAHVAFRDEILEPVSAERVACQFELDD
jgi:hypothetical protein